MAQLLVSQLLIYGLAWAVGWVIVREERWPIALWSLRSVLQAGGLALMIHPAPGSPPVPAPAAMLLLLSYVCADLGIDMFAHQGRARHLGLWLLLLITGEAVQAASLIWPLPEHLRAAAYNLSVAAALVGPMLVLRHALRHEFGGWGLLPMVPGTLLCALPLMRAVTVLVRPEAALETPLLVADNPTLLVATLFASGAFNVAFLALVVGRLVMRMHGLLDRDALTGLTNRGGLEKRLEESWGHASRHGLGLSVAFIDIDNFKHINDAGGHEAGDEVIRSVASALAHGARQTDHVGRWGGDEFMVVMPHTDHEAASHAMQRLRERLRVREAGTATPPGSPPLSLSIGVATRQPGDASPQALVRRADAAMYRGKKSRPGVAPAPEAGRGKMSPSHPSEKAHP